VDADDIFNIEEILLNYLKSQFGIQLVPALQIQEDQLHKGYYKLSKTEAGEFTGNHSYRFATASLRTARFFYPYTNFYSV
jgi:hypothetical protein